MAVLNLAKLGRGGLGVPVFVPSPAGMAAMQRMPGMVMALGQVATKIAETLKATAPYDADSYSSQKYGHYRDLINVSIEAEGLAPVARVNASKFTSHMLEFGTSTGLPAQHLLQRAVEANGYQLANDGGEE